MYEVDYKTIRMPQRGGFNRPPDTDVMLFHKHHVWSGSIRVLGQNYSHLICCNRFRNDHPRVRRGASGLCVNVDKNA